jgi:hypothetical protein
MRHFTTPDFWLLYNALPDSVRELVDKNYELLKADPTHPSLHFKEVAGLWSVRVDRRYRALAYREPDGFYWFWIGSHADYDKFMP